MGDLRRRKRSNVLDDFQILKISDTTSVSNLLNVFGTNYKISAGELVCPSPDQIKDLLDDIQAAENALHADDQILRAHGDLPL